VAGSGDRPEFPFPPHPPLMTRGRLVRLLGLFLLAVVATVISFAIVSRISGPRLLPGGSTAPAISADSTDGQHVTLFTAGSGTIPGRPTVIEFFETTCAICQREVAPLCKVKAAHPEADFYGLDAAREDARTVNNFRQSQGGGCIDFPLLLDPGSDALRAYSVAVVPTVYLVDGRGRIAYAGTGAGGVDGLSTALSNLGGNG
jgi:thiol-disulfide isomerase/thioredoxin